ncbi:tectonin domain-containing protein [uncultured Aquimarina sp.]|uniref:tectonin domain-containing protein n=1 Tax=uncultured Aquimarina sp. TaxID=575652 RepID=UPI00261DF217|nr:tectonin domain-containing protein [uncultured Aquimarina sp.]
MKKVLIYFLNLFVFILMSCSSEDIESFDESLEQSKPETEEISAFSKISCGDEITYNILPGDAIDVAANSKNIFKVAGNRGVYAFNESDGRWIYLGGQARRITVDGNNVIWITNHKNEIFRSTYYPSTQTNSRWTRMSGKATDIGANERGDVYILGDSDRGGEYDVYKRENNRWNKTGGRGKRIAAGNSDAQAWLVNKHSDIYKRVNGRWQKFPGKARDIAEGKGSKPHLYIVGNTPKGSNGYDVYVFDQVWCKVRGIGTNIAVRGDFPLISNGYNKSYIGCLIRFNGTPLCPF